MGITLNKRHKLICVIALGLVAVIAIAAVVVSILSPKKTPVPAEYITVTVDNSVSASFTLNNELYAVTNAQTYSNTDCFLVEKIGSSVSFSQAMDTFLKNLIDAKKLSLGQEEVLLFAVESRNEQDFETLSGYFKTVLKTHAPNARIYSLYIKVKQDDVQKLADKYSVSYAKAHLCMRLQKENNKLKAEDLIGLSVTEIVNLVNELGKEDLIDKIETETNEEQKKEEIPEDNTSGDSSSENSSSEDTSSDSTSSDTTSSDTTSSDSGSSDSTSSGDSGGKGPSFVVSEDESGWSPLV